MFIVDLEKNEGKPHPTFFEDEDIKVQFENNLLGPLIHCELGRWNREVMSKCLLVLEEICKEFAEKDIPAMFALVKEDDEKHKKFVTLMGFQYFAQGLSTNNEKFELWSLDPKVYMFEEEA